MGDAICLNSSLPCVLVDVVRCKMDKFSCCVLEYTNNWRNSPEKKFHTLPSDAKVRRLYEKLIWNETLKLNAQHTKRGRPRETWRRTIERELKENGLGTWAAAASAAEDRTAWRQRAYSPILHLENG